MDRTGIFAVRTRKGNETFTLHHVVTPLASGYAVTGLFYDFDEIEYRNFPLVVLNLRAPSILLGFQLGGIVGHKFLAPFRVTMDMERSELLLERF